MRARAGRLAVFVLGLTLGLAAVARAETVEGDDLWVIAPDARHAVAVEVRDAFPRMLADVEQWLGVPTEGFVQIHLVEGLDAMRAALGRWVAPEHAGACSPPALIGIRLDLTGTSMGPTLHEVLAHEIVHHVLSQLPRPAPPRWFEEGLATVWTGGLPFGFQVWLESWGALDALPSFDSFQLGEDGERGERDYLVYVVGSYAVEHFLALHGHGGLRALISRLEAGQAFAGAFTAVAGMPVEAFEADWRHSVARRGRGASLVLPALLVLGLAVVGAVLHVVRRVRGAPGERAEDSAVARDEGPPTPEA